MAGPLAGAVRVLDLSERSPAAAIAGMVLADLGAEVIRVEPEGGDPLRALAGAAVWLRGQQSVTVTASDLRDRRWSALRDSADVIIDTAQPWTQKPAGLTDGLRDDPAKIFARLTAYPRTIDELSRPDRGANYPVCGELIEAQYGMQHFQHGVRDGGPIFLGWPHAINGAAWMLEIGILGALFERARTGSGQLVTTSMLDGIAILSNARWLGGLKLGSPLYAGSRITTRASNMRIIVHLFQCSDGKWIQVHTGPRGAFERMLKVVGRDDLVIENAGLHVLGVPLDPTVAPDLWSHLDVTFRGKSAQEWCDTLAASDVCCMPALQPGEALWLKQMEDNELVDILPDGCRRLGRLAKFSRTPLEIRRDVPAVGAHNSVHLGGSVKPRANGSRRNGSGGIYGSQVAHRANRVGPLDGILVLDFGAYMAGPFANRLFADLGARVIKIEEYGGDPMRGPQLSILLGVQRGKESLAIDLKSPDGRRIVHDLVRKADIVHNNMRVGAMEKLGVGWEQLRALNPRLIYCHSSGYGNAGDWSRLPTFEPLHSALTGMLSRTGGAGNQPEHYLTHMDYGCGLTSAAMVIAALAERERSGGGQYIEVPQTGAGLLAMSDVHGTREHLSETFPLDREQRGHAPTNALYRTTDGWIVIACYSDREWCGVRRALGFDNATESANSEPRPSGFDNALSSSITDAHAHGSDHAPWPSFAEARAQRLSDSAIARSLEASFAKLTTESAMRRLRAEAVPCTIPAPFSPAEVIVDPAMLSRGVIVREEHPAAGEIFEVGHTLRFGNANSHNVRPAPLTGQHSVEILRELGRSEADINALLANKVVNSPATPASGELHARF